MSKARKSYEVEPVKMASLMGGLPPNVVDPIKAADTTVERKTRTIGLDSLPDVEIESDSDADAIRQYNALMGINSTINQYRIK